MAQTMLFHENKNKIMIDFDKYSFCKKQYAITVCRIEPENNIDIILKTFSHQTKIQLVIIGNWLNSNYGMQLLQKYRQFAHLHLFDPIYESKTLNFLRSHAAIYIHGHSAGGTNPSLIEAMFLGLPIFAFDCIYNRYTTVNKCKYWSDSDELYNFILQTDEIELLNISKSMKQIANERYRWKIIIEKYEHLYN
jgi:glycosyltransferase involved in cell wall biosynthesis